MEGKRKEGIGEVEAQREGNPPDNDDNSSHFFLETTWTPLSGGRADNFARRTHERKGGKGNGIWDCHREKELGAPKSCRLEGHADFFVPESAGEIAFAKPKAVRPCTHAACTPASLIKSPASSWTIATSMEIPYMAGQIVQSWTAQWIPHITDHMTGNRSVHFCLAPPPPSGAFSRQMTVRVGGASEIIWNKHNGHKAFEVEKPVSTCFLHSSRSTRILGAFAERHVQEGTRPVRVPLFVFSARPSKEPGFRAREEALSWNEGQQVNQVRGQSMMKHTKQWLGLLGALAVLGCTAPEMLAQAPDVPEDAVSAPNRVVGQDVGEPSSEVARWKELEAHLSRLESRLEDYRRSQDGALAEIDATLATRLRTLEAGIDARCDESTQKEVEAIQKQSQTALAKTLEMAQSKHDKDAIELRQCMGKWHAEDIAAFKTMRIFFGFLILALVGLCVLVWKNKAMTDNWRYCFETVVLVAVMLLISWGAYHLLDRIVAYGEERYAIQAIDSPDAHLATRQAYEQLSNELEHWAVLFGVMGTFFGLIIPAGGYLLQLKAVKREEEKTDKAIQDALSAFAKEMSEMVDKKVTEVDTKVESKVEEIWEDFSDMQYVEYGKCHLELLAYDDKSKLDIGQLISLWARWCISFLSVAWTLPHVSNEKFVKVKLGALISDLKEVLENPDFAHMRHKFVQMRSEKPTQSAKWLEKLHERFPTDVDELKPLLKNAGFSFQ